MFIEVKPCWYCSKANSYQLIIPKYGEVYLLCECGASTVPMITLKVIKNRLGGVCRIVYKKVFGDRLK